MNKLAFGKELFSETKTLNDCNSICSLVKYYCVINVYSFLYEINIQNIQYLYFKLH